MRGQRSGPLWGSADAVLQVGPSRWAQEGLRAGQQGSSLKNSGGEKRCGEDLGVVMGDLDS